MNVVSLLPNLAKDKFCFSQGEMGLVFSVFEVSQLAFTLVVSSCLKKIGRRRAIISGLFVQILATVGFGSLTLLPS